jgi:hypothetical protein
LLLPALVLPLVPPLPAAVAVGVVVAGALLALPLEDLKEDKRFCAEDLRRIMGRRMDWESGIRGDIQHSFEEKGSDPKSNQTLTLIRHQRR